LAFSRRKSVGRITRKELFVVQVRNGLQTI
jgi:hypothetical protein